MKKTLQKRTTQLHRSASLPRIGVEVLESRTLLSAGHGPEHAQHLNIDNEGAVFRTIAIPTPTGVSVSLMPTGSSSLNVVGLASGESIAWHLDGNGHAMLSGTIIQISANGTTTTQDVMITTGDGSTTSADSKDQTDGSGNCPQPAPGTTTPGTTTGNGNGSGTAKPGIQHPGGSPGSQTGSTPQTPPTSPGPTPQDSGSAQPSIARPTPQPTDPTGNNTAASSGPAVTPLAMTPAGPSFVPQPASTVVPSSSVSNIPNVPATIGASTYSATNVTANLPTVHELARAPEHAFTTLAAITPPINFMANVPLAAAASSVQAATASVHVSEVAGDDTSPGTYVFASAAPSLPARIAYNFVRLDAAAFHDTAHAFAAELAALNVANDDKSHTRAWAITAGVLTADIALLVYWHRQAKRRKLLLQTEPPV